jgi:hypothetical protein
VVVIGISDQFQTVKYIGVGEGIEDLQVFNKYEFVDSFFLIVRMNFSSLKIRHQCTFIWYNFFCIGKCDSG